VGKCHAVIAVFSIGDRFNTMTELGVFVPAYSGLLYSRIMRHKKGSVDGLKKLHSGAKWNGAILTFGDPEGKIYVLVSSGYVYYQNRGKCYQLCYQF
jgi:hypothetical protein